MQKKTDENFTYSSNQNELLLSINEIHKVLKEYRITNYYQ